MHAPSQALHRAVATALLAGLLVALAAPALGAIQFPPLMNYTLPQGWVEELVERPELDNFRSRLTLHPDNTRVPGLSSGVVVTMTTPGDEMYWDSAEDFYEFNARNIAPLEEDYRTDSVLTDTRDTATIDGRQAFHWVGEQIIVYNYSAQGPGYDNSVYHNIYERWFVPVGGTGVYIMNDSLANVMTPDPVSDVTGEMLQMMREDAEAGRALVASFDLGGGGGGGTPWQAIFGGALALASAAAALAGAFASTKAGAERARKNPNTVIGYILQVSEPSVAPQKSVSTPLSASAYRVLASGATEAAPDVTITFTPPPGVALDPAVGAGSLTALVWATDVKTPPGSHITVSGTGPGGGTSTQVAVDAASTLELSEDRIATAMGSGAQQQVRAWVASPGASTWTVSAHWVGDARPPAVINTMPEPGTSSATLTLTENGGAVSTGKPEAVYRILVRAEAPGRELLERELTYVVAAEGVFIDPVPAHPDGSFHVKADGSREPKDLFFRVMRFDATSKQLISDTDAAAGLEIVPVADPGTPERNIFEAARVQFAAFNPTAEKPPQVEWRAIARNDVPGENPGDATPVRMRAYAPGLSAEVFTCDFTLGLVLSDSPTPSELIALERERLQHVIDTFTPPELRPRMQRLLDEQGSRLGPEGMAYLRQRVWEESRDAVVAEGENWLWWSKLHDQVDYYLTNWVIWAGDLCFSVLMGAYTGPYAAMAANFTKQMFISAITAIVTGKSASTWASEQVWSLLYLFEGRAIDIDTFSSISGASRAKCWVVFCIYHFIKAALQQEEFSLPDAVRATAWQVADVKIAEWLGQQVKAEMNARGLKEQPRGKAPVDDETAARKAEDEARRAAEGDSGKAQAEREARAKAFADEIAGKPKDEDGQPLLDVNTIKRIAADPDAARIMKDKYPDAWNAYTKERYGQIYQEHDPALERWVVENLPDEHQGRPVEVRTFGGKTGVDRDYRVGYLVPNKKGEMDFIEIPKEKWKSASQRILAEKTGGSIDPDKAAADAKKMQWRPTDAADAEAARDLADQRTVIDPDTGKPMKVQVKPNVGWDSDGNIVGKVPEGAGKLDDAHGLGETFKSKVADSYHEGNRLDAFKQASKAAKTLDGCRGGYDKQGFDVPEVPPKVREGMDLIDQVTAGKMTPEAAETRLKELKIDGLTGLTEKLAGEFGKFDYLRKK